LAVILIISTRRSKSSPLIISSSNKEEGKIRKLRENKTNGKKRVKENCILNNILLS